jgi:hypothetical protein
MFDAVHDSTTGVKAVRPRVYTSALPDEPA